MFYKNIIGLDPYDLDGWEGLGNFYAENKEYDKALVCYEKSVELAPYDVDLWINMGNSYTAKKDYNNAIKCYEKAINIAPDHAIRRKIPIIEIYKKVIDLNPDDVDLWINMGYVYEYKKEQNKAIDCFEKALEVDPTNALARYKFNKAYEEKNK